MILNIYHKRNSADNAQQSIIRLVHVNKAHRILSFNTCSVRDFGLQKGMTVLFAQDTDTGLWYVSFGNDPNGMKLNDGNKRNSGLRTQSKDVATLLCDAAKAEKSVTLSISATAKEEDGINWYRIITKTPYRKR